MKIKSDFHDYYDIVLKHGIDDDVVFIRKEKEIPISEIKFHLPKFEFFQYQLFNELRYDYNGGIIFCGKFYPVLWFSKRGDNEFYFCSEREFMSLRTKMDFGLITRSQNKLRELSYKDFTDLHREVGSPIIYVGLESGRYLDYIVINPLLKRYQFQKVKDPYTTFQDIDFFISNFMGTMPEMVTLSNEDRIVKHGFDKKTSFRKDKKN
jgi:hypothetical protein